MTQFFTYRGFGLRKASLQIRVLVTSFIVMASLGVGVGFLNYQVRTGLTTEGSAAWYRGGSPDAAGSLVDRTGPLYEKSPLELLDATHPHLFNQAFLFFVLGHLLALCAVPPGRKTAIYAGGFVGVLVDTASPWLIRYGGAGFAYLQLAGHVVMALAFVALLFYPLREMWGPPPRKRRRGTP